MSISSVAKARMLCICWARSVKSVQNTLPMILTASIGIAHQAPGKVVIMVVVWFFDKWAWMGEDDDFEGKFEEVHGEGSWDRWMNDWIGATNGTDTEFWVYREDLSGLDANVVVAERQ